MDYNRFKNNETIAFAVVATFWLLTLLVVWVSCFYPVIESPLNIRLFGLALLSVGSAVSVFWLFRLRLADIRLTVDLLEKCAEWRQGVVTSRITHIGGRVRTMQQLAWSMNDLMDQVETAQVDMRFSLAYVTWGDFSRKSYPDGLHGGFARALRELNKVTGVLSHLTKSVSELMHAIADGDFSKRVDDIEFKGEYKLTIDRAFQAMQLMQTMIGDIGKVMDGVAQGDISQRVRADGTGELNKLKGDINLSLDALRGSLSDILLIAGALSDGNLTQTINKNYPGTFGEVIEGMNSTVVNLRKLVGGIKDSTSHINTASKEIAAGNNDLSHRTEEQASSLQETAASMAQLTSTVQMNALSAEHANELAVGATDIAGKGVLVVNRVVSTMEGINESSRKIVDIITVIDSIAFQTNILALNAAVEAARAGEQGRGFAVVAGEVRNLAQRAAAAAGEIKNLIGDSVEKVEDGTKLVAQAGKTMEEIVAAIRGVTVIMSEIRAASIEQTSGIEQVNQAITQMDEVTQQNAALVEQAAAAAESLEDQAQNLSVTVGRFMVGENESYAAEPMMMPHAKKEAVVTRKNLQKQPNNQSIPLGEGEEWEEF